MYKQRLEEYIEKDKIYQAYKKQKEFETSDFDNFCILHCEDIEDLLKEVEELHNKIDKAIEYMNGEEFFLLMNSIQTPDKAVCEDYFKAKGNLLEILKDSDVDD